MLPSKLAEHSEILTASARRLTLIPNTSFAGSANTERLSNNVSKEESTISNNKDSQITYEMLPHTGEQILCYYLQGLEGKITATAAWIRRTQPILIILVNSLVNTLSVVWAMPEGVLQQ